MLRSRTSLTLIPAGLLFVLIWPPSAIAQPAPMQVSPADVFDAEDPGFVHQEETPPPAIQRFKKQAVQSVSFSGGWLGAIDNDLSSSFFQTSVGLGVPLGNFDNILGVTPSFRADFIDATPDIDVPEELFETGVSFFYRRPLNDHWSALAIVTPSVRSDFTTSDKALRIFGLALLTWDCVPDKLSMSFGTVYLDRADVPLLPAVGLTWTPRPEMLMELRFPQSRIAWRLAKDGAQSESWLYTTAGLGGNTWAVTRASGVSDELSLRDIRVLLGVDHITDGGGGWFAEVGYAFNRRIEYQSTQTDIDLSDGILLQAGWRY